MKKVYTISALAFLGILITGCNPQLASSGLNETEVSWKKMVKEDYPGWKGPAVVAPKNRGILERPVEPMTEEAYNFTATEEAVTMSEPGLEIKESVVEESYVDDGDDLIFEGDDLIFEGDDVVAEESAPEMVEYVVQKGDSLDKIARKFYGKPDWKPIVEANPKQFKNGSTMVKIGSKLVIPKK